MLWRESELVKSSRTKWPLSVGAGCRGGGANAVVSPLEGCSSVRVKQFSYCMPSSGGAQQFSSCSTIRMCSRLGSDGGGFWNVGFEVRWSLAACWPVFRQ